MTLTKVVGGVIADSTITSADITDSTITNAKMAVDPSNASNLSSGDVPLAQLDNVPPPNLSPALEDIALLAFKTQANGSLSRYNLVDQSVDAFEDATGISASDSTNEVRNSAGKYYSGISTVTVSGNYDDSGVDGEYTYYKWTTVTSSGSFTTDGAQDYEYLVVAGGGAGGGCGTGGQGGGGGAGGFRTATGFPVAVGTVGSITVGAGGQGYLFPGTAGKGADSVFSTITSAGGGGGADYNSPATTGGSGGGGSSGSPGGGIENGAAGNVPSTSPVQGYAGGSATTGDANGGGGGGGSSSVGINATGNAGANGGVGTASSITGSSVSYGGGGGGGADAPYPAGSGGTGGGGPGCNTAQCTATAGTANTGGGGGGAGEGGGPGGTGGNGGSGIVVIRRLTAGDEGENMTLESITTTTATAPTKGDLVFTYSNGAGTSVVGTNITAEYSADAGSTWTDFGIAAGDVQGTTAGHTNVTKNDVSLTSTSGTNMRNRIKTLVQSASLQTRIHAVSLGWS